MKTAALLVVFTTMVATSAYAAECTKDQLTTWSATSTAACGFEITDPTAKMTPDEICANTKCMSALKDSIKSFPDCTVNGKNVATQLTASITGIEKLCTAGAKGAASTAPSPANTPKPAAAAPAPAGSSAVGLASASAAAVATATVVGFFA